MMNRLNNKHILVGITGGIAAYKAAELVRLLKKAGSQVRVVMTQAATQFITPLTLQALSSNPVRTQLLDEEAEAGMGHIELAKWADFIIIAPATADFIARLNQGKGDDLLTTLCLATTAPLAIAPAMNQAMWNNPMTKDNLTAICAKGVLIYGPARGEQACGDNGPGRLLEPGQILELIASQFESRELDGKLVVITAGPTREAIDPVRYISNHSSGKMGYALALAAEEAGATVVLISGPVAIPVPDNVQCVNVQTAQEMLEASLAAVKKSDIFISVAAVCDYKPEIPAQQKLKKQQSTDKLLLKLVKNPDIVKTIANLPDRPFTIGFAAETENIIAYAKTKLLEKNLDLICANEALSAFHNHENQITLLWHDGEKQLPVSTKYLQAKEIIHWIAKRVD